MLNIVVQMMRAWFGNTVFVKQSGKIKARILHAL
jgi:hypothetical protein